MYKIECYAPYWYGHCTPMAKLISALQSQTNQYQITYVIYKLFEEKLKAQFPSIKYKTIHPEFTQSFLEELMGKYVGQMLPYSLNAYEEYFKTKEDKPDLIITDFMVRQASKYARKNNIKLIVNFPTSYSKTQQLFNFITLDRSINIDGVLINYSLPILGLQLFDDLLDSFRGHGRVVFQSFIGLDNPGIVPTHHSLIGFFEPEQERINSIPKDLEEWMANWKKNGKEKFIYVAFGSLVRLGPKFIKQIVRIAQNLSYPIIWSLRSPFSQEVNHPLIYHRPWLHQQAILALPQIKAFLTHCGWGSICQSIVFKTPMICVPVFADQPKNAKLAVLRKIGVQIFETTYIRCPAIFQPQISDQQAFSKIKEVMENPIYQQNIERMNKMNKFINATESICKIVYETLNFGHEHLINDHYEKATIKTGVNYKDILSESYKQIQDQKFALSAHQNSKK